jgi:hypothetical protein
MHAITHTHAYASARHMLLYSRQAHHSSLPQATEVLQHGSTSLFCACSGRCASQLPVACHSQAGGCTPCQRLRAPQHVMWPQGATATCQPPHVVGTRRSAPAGRGCRVLCVHAAPLSHPIPAVCSSLPYSTPPLHQEKEEGFVCFRATACPIIAPTHHVHSKGEHTARVAHCQGAVLWLRIARHSNEAHHTCTASIPAYPI